MSWMFANETGAPRVCFAGWDAGRRGAHLSGWDLVRGNWRAMPALDAAVTCRLRMPPTCGEVSGGVAGQDAGRV